MLVLLAEGVLVLEVLEGLVDVLPKVEVLLDVLILLILVVFTL